MAVNFKGGFTVLDKTGEYDGNLDKYKTEFIPVDSEHFSIWYSLKGIHKSMIEKIYLTASGGPFLNKSIKKLKKVNISKVTNNPNGKREKKE